MISSDCWRRTQSSSQPPDARSSLQQVQQTPHQLAPAAQAFLTIMSGTAGMVLADHLLVEDRSLDLEEEKLKHQTTETKEETEPLLVKGEETEVCIFNDQGPFSVKEEMEPLTVTLVLTPPEIKEDWEEPKLLQVKEEKEEPEFLLVQEDWEEPKLLQIKEEWEEPKLLQIKEDWEEPELLDVKEEWEEAELKCVKEEREEPEPVAVKEEPEEEELVVKQEADTFSMTLGHEHKDDSEDKDLRHPNHRNHRDDVDDSETNVASCEVCGKFFVERKCLTVHMSSHTRKRKYGCEWCSKTFTRPWVRERHMKTHSAEKPFIEKSSLNVHTRIHTGEKLFSCQNCGKEFTEQSSLNEHRRSHTGDKSFSFPRFQKGFNRQTLLVEQMKTQTGERPYSCQICGSTFRRSSHLSVHRRTHTSLKPFKCLICGKGYLWSASLIAHSKTHTDKTPVATPKKILIRVLRSSHTGEKLFSVNSVPQFMLEKSSPNVHMTSHMGEKLITCPRCQKGFTKETHLVEHMKTHIGEKPYFQNCGEIFRYRSHVSVHTSVRPFKCLICGKLFSWHTSLIAHSKTHTHKQPVAAPKKMIRFIHRSHIGDKSFSSMSFGKEFTDTSSLNEPQRTPTSETPFKCLTCGELFSCHTSLIAHSKTHVHKQSVVDRDRIRIRVNNKVFMV